MKKTRKLSLWIFVGLLSLGQLQRIELNQLGLVFYLHDVFITIWLLQLLLTEPVDLISYLAKQLKKSKKLQLFIAITLTSVLINNFRNPELTTILYNLRLITYLGFGTSLAFLIKKKVIEPEYFKFQVFSVGLISLFAGFLQYIFIKDTRFLAILGWDDHYARLISTYLDPAFTGIIFLITLLTGLSSRYLGNNKVKATVTLLFLWGIVLTFSRASYLATIVAFTTIALVKIKNKTKLLKQLPLIFLIFLIMIFFSPKPWGEGVNLFRTSTINARTIAIKKQLKTLNLKVLVIGNGLYAKNNGFLTRKNTIIPSHSRVPDNLMINLLLSTGVAGLVVFTALLLDWAKRLRKKDAFILASFVAILLHTQFSNTMLQPFVLLIFLSSLASSTN